MQSPSGDKHSTRGRKSSQKERDKQCQRVRQTVYQRETGSLPEGDRNSTRGSQEV